jgi:hypothetical protein
MNTSPRRMRGAGLGFLGEPWGLDVAALGGNSRAAISIQAAVKSALKQDKKYRSIKTLVRSLPKSVKIHTSEKPIGPLVARNLKKGRKPSGLWYACGSQWLDWKHAEGYEVEDFVYLVRINEERILRLDSEQKVLEFSAKFSVEGGELVDWVAVAGAGWSGVEICPYQNSLRMSPEVDWYYSWDVASGCVWNPSEIEVELVGNWDGEKIVKAGGRP